jgi:transposase
MRPEERIQEREEYARGFAVHVGVDAGKAFHKLVACGLDRVRTKALKVDVHRLGFLAAIEFLTAAFPGVVPAETLVAIEFGGHYGYTFAEFLRARGFAVVTMPSVVTKRLKEIEDNSPRKDDAKDAAQVCKLVGAGLFVTYAELPPLVAEMRVLTTESHNLARQETALRNRLRAILDLAWPEFQTHVPRIDTRTARALLRRWPVAGDLAAATTRSVHAVMKDVSRNHFTLDQARTLIASAKASIAITRGAEARRDEIVRLLDRWELNLAQEKAIEARLTALVAQHPGAKALATVPQVGALCAASLVAEIGTPEHFASPRQVLKLAGMNLARRESGTSLRGRVHQTKRGRPQLRRQLYLLAGRWCQRSGPYRPAYEALKARNGGLNTSALCAIARRLVPMLLHIMQTGEPFDRARWQRDRTDPVLTPAA